MPSRIARCRRWIFAEVDPSLMLFGRRLAAPLLISCMTGGTPEATVINRRLARVAAQHGLAMGLGSGRALLESPATLESFDVRAEAPEVLLFANLGAVQLNKGYGVAECRSSRCDARTPMRWCCISIRCKRRCKPRATPVFAGSSSDIADICAQSEFPIVVKEVGSGIGPSDVRALFDAGVAAVDVAGAGGTSWSEVERHRIEEPWRASVAAAFAGWGIPTAQAIVDARAVAPVETIIASGGILSGLDVAKAIALGADLAGVAGPFLRAADKGLEAALELAAQYVETLRIAMFCTGARTLAELRRVTLTASP